MSEYLWVGIGGAIGSMARFWISGVVAERYGAFFPYGTLTVNVTGSFVIGVLAALAEPDGHWLITPAMRGFLMIGICGGYTTFSSFSLQTLALVQEGSWWRAGANAIASFALCLIAVWLGHFAVSLVNRA
ncbi:MAG: fluoride efflux transporter CrcB [Chthoniobacterales bacterium]